MSIANEKHFNIDFNMYTQLLKAASLKATKKRLILLSILKSKKCPTTAEEIFDEISNIMNLSTVYRALNAMSEKEILIKSIHMDGKTYFQFNDHVHKHELICSVCHRSVDVEDCPFEEISKTIAEKTGFEITGHNVEFTGICPNCLEEFNKKD